MERLKVSMITICYNAEKTIAKTIESVLSQDYENLEYIIVDGGSKDHTIDIIKSYENEKIRWISEKDNGISDAFNKGVKMATGDFIGLINADDYLLPHAIANLILACHECTDVLYGNTIVNDEENELKLVKHAGSVEGLEYSLPFIHQSSLVSKKAYEQYGGYSEKYKICMDYDLFARFYRGGAKFQFVNTVVSCFTYGGTSCRHPFQTIEEDISVAEKYGLSHSKAMRYKIKMYTKNSIKIVLTRLRIWKAFYCLIKRDSIYKY
ncbi:glycosyltransferase [Ruminococcus sp. OF02-6]|nr:glycosyltransferase [Ruminococcus sp. OF02-6]